MSEKENELLIEFEDLIRTIGKEVAEDISAKISAEAVENITQSIVIQELKRLTNNANDLMKTMPEIRREMEHTLDDIKGVSGQTGENLSSALSANGSAKELLLKTHDVSNDLCNQLNEFLNKMDISLSKSNQEIMEKCSHIEKRIKEFEGRLNEQSKAIDDLNRILSNRGSN